MGYECLARPQALPKIRFSFGSIGIGFLRGSKTRSSSETRLSVAKPDFSGLWALSQKPYFCPATHFFQDTEAMCSYIIGT